MRATEVRIIKSRVSATLSAAKHRVAFSHERLFGFVIIGIGVMAMLLSILPLVIPLLEVMLEKDPTLNWRLPGYVLLVTGMCSCMGVVVWLLFTATGLSELRHDTRATIVLLVDQNMVHLDRDTAQLLDEALLYGFGDEPLRFAFSSKQAAVSAGTYFEHMLNAPDKRQVQRAALGRTQRTGGRAPSVANVRVSRIHQTLHC